MTDDNLRELASQLPYDRPGADRTEGVRASLLAAAVVPVQPSPRRWLLVGGGFAVGALAAAAIAILMVRSPSSSSPHEAYARIESSSAAAVEHTLAATPSGGTDEIVRVHAGTLHLAVPAPRKGDRVRVATADAEIEGAGEYEVVVAAEALSRVTVTSGSATIRIVGKQDAVFLAAGQTWRAAIQTADLTPVVPAPSSGTTTARGSPIETSLDGTSATPPAANVATPSATGPTGPTTASGSPIETQVDGASSSSSTPAGAGATATNSPTSRSNSPTSRAAAPTSRAAASNTPTTSTSPSTAANPRATSPSPATTDGSPIEAELAPPTRPAVTEPQLTTDATPPPPVAKPGSEIERHFRAGTALLRANKLAEAVLELLGAAADAGESPLAADARYYQAVALVKAKRGPEAERALVQFLDRAPTSLRRGRAAMMLGRLLADRGDAKTARDWFAVAAKDSDATVAAAAQAALKAR